MTKLKVAIPYKWLPLKIILLQFILESVIHMLFLVCSISFFKYVYILIVIY